MKILITGNMGYVGPRVVNRLRNSYPNAKLIGYDMGYFGTCLTNASVLPESKLDMQYYGDVRDMPPELLYGVDAVVHLAAISNDPMGLKYEEVTFNVNYRSSIKLAEMAKEAGVRSFIFASSCSMYGESGEDVKTEASTLNPLTAYARSKVLTEEGLSQLVDDGFTVTCLRFATACGMSERLRLDLVLNDFVASAVATGTVQILSDGSPWRPLIHVNDMAKAIDWAIDRWPENGGAFLAVNAGSDTWNYRVIELAGMVADIIPGVTVSLNREAAPDKRSYRVSFERYKTLAPYYQPSYTLASTIEELADNLRQMAFKDAHFRNSKLMRLQMLNYLQETDEINSELEWQQKMQKVWAES
ncbi:SDR family oxidoreductase [Olivibacter sp. SDN3]|uniref:NAD-dependent epimerase/dehydratase family protein n=1 Tax=Olivibacter sp. SDN3 TaxID=2764720 RepID=UPI001650F1AF|nr:SDR family oxidoreductase [Olivibacter sp. SDN3]QNL51721.1 SDR family oxidoreductase [Olivibacter sp. SDN3]